jgi:hypothetical protein
VGAGGFGLLVSAVPGVGTTLDGGRIVIGKKVDVVHGLKRPWLGFGFFQRVPPDGRVGSDGSILRVRGEIIGNCKCPGLRGKRMTALDCGWGEPLE